MSLPSFVLATPDAPVAPDPRVAVLERRCDRLRAACHLLHDLAGVVELPALARRTVDGLAEVLELDRCSIYLAPRGASQARLVASSEDPAIHNYAVELDRYPELAQAIETGQTVFIPDALVDPRLASAREPLERRRVREIVVVPVRWRETPVGAIFLRTAGDSPALGTEELALAALVADAVGRALAAAWRVERLERGVGLDPAQRVADLERAALVEFLGRLLDAFGRRREQLGVASADGGAELDRLVGVAMTVLSQDAAGR